MRASTRITHTDERAYVAACAVANAAVVAAQKGTFDAEVGLQSILGPGKNDEAWCGMVDTMRRELAAGHDTATFAAAIGQADFVTGFAFHSVPVALYAWLRHSADFERAMTEVLATGGGRRQHRGGDRRVGRCSGWRVGDPGGLAPRGGGLADLDGAGAARGGG